MRGIENILPYLSLAADILPIARTGGIIAPGRGRKVRGKRHASQLERANRRKAKRRS